MANLGIVNFSGGESLFSAPLSLMVSKFFIVGGGPHNPLPMVSHSMAAILLFEIQNGRQFFLKIVLIDIWFSLER